MSMLSSDRCIQEAAWVSVAPPSWAVVTRRVEAEQGEGGVHGVARALNVVQPAPAT